MDFNLNFESQDLLVTLLSLLPCDMVLHHVEKCPGVSPNSLWIIEDFWFRSLFMAVLWGTTASEYSPLDQRQPQIWLAFMMFHYWQFQTHCRNLIFFLQITEKGICLFSPLFGGDFLQHFTLSCLFFLTISGFYATLLDTRPFSKSNWVCKCIYTHQMPLLNMFCPGDKTIPFLNLHRDTVLLLSGQSCLLHCRKVW